MPPTAVSPRARTTAQGEPSAAAGGWSPRTRAIIAFAPAAFLLVAFVALLIGLEVGGGAVALAISDPGPVVMYGVPVTRLLYNVAAAVTIGGLVLAAWAASRDEPEFERMMQIASGAAAAWTVIAMAAAFFTFLQISNVPLSADASFGEQLWFFFSGIELGRLWLLDVVMIAILSTVVFAVRGKWGVGLAAAFSLLCLWPLASQGHAAGAADHELAVGGITLHYMGAAFWLGGIIVLAVLLPGIRADRRVVLLERYSTLALVAFIVVASSGMVASAINVGSLAALASPYGAIVIAKAAALVGLGVLGWLQRRMLIGRMRERTAAGGSGRAPLAWLLAFEIAFMGVAAGAAAALGRTPSPVTQLTADELAAPTPAQILTGELLPPEFTTMRLLTEWTLDPIWTTVIVFGLFFYIAGVWRLHRRGDAWPVGRTISFVLGMLVLLYLVNGALIVYGKYMFSFHMTQHMLLTMLVPIFLVLSAPVTLIMRAVHARHDGSMGTREWVLLAVHSKWGAFISHPIVSAIIFAFSLLVFYYTPLFRWAVTDHVGHMWMVLDFTVVGFLFVSSLIGIDPGPNRPAYPIRLIALIIVMTFHAFFSLAVMTGTGLIMADWFGAMGRPWGASALADQQMGGAIAWGIGEFPMVILAILVAFAWSRSDEREAKRRDRKAARDGDAELEAYNARLAAIAERDAAREAREARAAGTGAGDRA